MPVNHNINVRLFSGGEATTKTSAKGSVKRSLEKTSERGNMTSRKIARGIRAVRTLDLGSLGLFGGVAGAGSAIVQESAKLANKAIDLFVDITQSATGEKIRAGNIKRIKGYLLNPSSYLKDALYTTSLQSMEISRQNQSNDYYRELTGNLIVSKQYGEKR